MSEEIVCEVARYRRQGDAEELAEQVRLILDDETLHLSYHDGRGTSCDDSDPCEVIATEPDLHQVRVGQVTRIQGYPEVIERLPLLLRVTVASATPDSAEAITDANIDDAEDCDLYVSDQWWAPWQTTEGLRFCPTGAFVTDSPDLSPAWVQISFIETASRTSGYFTGQLGLITAAVVADIYDPDEDATVVTLSSRADDAQTVANWLLHGGFSRDFYGGDSDGMAMLTQLFVDAALHPDGYDRINGDDLAAGITQYAEGFGSSPTAEWGMSLNLDDAVIHKVLDLLSETDPQLADIVTAARDPESPPGRARAAALKEIAEDCEANDND